MLRLSGRQWVSVVAGSVAASLAVVGGWSAGWERRRTGDFGRISRVAYIGQTVRVVLQDKF